MGMKKLIEKLKQVLETDAEVDRRKRHDALKDILKKLKAKQDKLEAKYAKAEGEDKAKLGKKIKLAKAHRGKAIKTLREMKTS